MRTILDLLDKIFEYYGQTASTIVLVIIVVVYSVYLITRKHSSLLKTYLEKRWDRQEQIHADTTQHRKNITPRIRQELSELAEEVGADRAIVCEFSNGSSNLIGLPFLYMSATYEVVTPGTLPISYQYQKINTSILAEFLEKLDEKGYFYVEDIEEIKNDLPILYNMMKPNGAKSMLFYTIRGMHDAIGFIIIVKVNEETFTRDDTLPKAANAAQVISSYLNFDRLHEKL